MKDLLSRYPALTPCAGTIEAALDILLGGEKITDGVELYTDLVKLYHSKVSF